MFVPCMFYIYMFDLRSDLVEFMPKVIIIIICIVFTIPW